MVFTDVSEFGFNDHKGVPNYKIKNKSANKNIEVIWNIYKRFFNANNITKFKEQIKETNWLAVFKPNNNINEN